MAIPLAWIRACAKNEDYEVSSHADDEAQDENISIDDIEAVLMNGEILEQYQPGGRRKDPCCLLSGTGLDNRPIHVVIAQTKYGMRIVTTYLPKPPQFIDPKTRSKK